MTSLFSSILDMSIIASYVAIAVIVIRIFMKKVPKIFSYILWLPVLIRLVMPFSFNSRLSIFGFLKPEDQTSNEIMKFAQNNFGFIQNPIVDVGANELNNSAATTVSSATPVASANHLPGIMEIASYIWVIGIVALLIYSILSYMKVLRNVKTATLVEGNVFETDRISSPFLCGFIRPKIYVPIGLNENELSYILKHEQTHIRRLDYIVKPFAFLALIIHWFNPLMWLSFALMSKDMEMSCDESVIKQMGNNIKGSYSNSLLSLSVKRSGLMIGSPIAFGESNIKPRVKNILNYKRPAFWVAAMVIVITTVLMVSFTANPINGQVIAQSTSTVKNAQVEKDVEKKLETIMSSPKESSNPYDYIKAHQKEYNSILGMGEQAYTYLQGQLKKSNTKGLRYQIITQLCKDFKKDVTDNSLLTKYDQIEKYLETIMSSPKESSNPHDYIKAHQKEYNSILGMGEQAYTYLQGQLKKSNTKGLRYQIIIQLCKDLKKDITNKSQLSDDSQYSDLTKDWYSENGANLTTQYNTAIKYIERRGYKIIMDSGVAMGVRLPENYTTKSGDVKIGEFLYEKNEQSKKKGFDFTEFMGTSINLFGYEITKDDTPVGFIFVLFSNDNLVGTWIDESKDVQDLKIILSNLEAYSFDGTPILNDKNTK